MAARSALLVVIVAASVVASAAFAQTSVSRGTYAARVEEQAGSCCSQSCGAVSIAGDVTLTLAADGTATLHWVRSGCSVTIGARPGVPQLMPSDPGPPEVVCAMAGSGVTRTYDADVTLRGTWRSDGPAAAIALDHETTMRCVPETIDGQALVSCTIEGGDLDRRGLTLGGRVHLDRRPGLVERLDHAQQLVLDRR